MAVELFLPSDEWKNSLKRALTNPGVLAGLGAAGILTGPLAIMSLPILLPMLAFSPLIQMSVWSWLIAKYMERQRKMKVEAILKTFGDKYSKAELERLGKENRKELNRLYKLASDEFFRKFIKEQGDHKKAQELIVKLQQRIDAMKARYAKLEKSARETDERLRELEEEIRMFEENLAQWKKAQ